MSRSSKRHALEVGPDILPPTVLADALSKQYVVRDATSSKGRFRTRKTIRIDSLKDASFASFAGDSIGVLGQNGSGKSTLLNLIAGQEAPTSGQLRVKSQPVMLGISAALNPQLSGEKNIELGCLAMGMTPTQVKERMPDIIDLSGIGDAIYRPMRTYSAGMSSRLKFAIGTSIDPDILLIDEALSAGDAAFSGRAKSRMDELLGKAGTVFLVSHSAPQVRQLCNRAIWIHLGEIIADGDIDQITTWYEEWTGLMGKKKVDSAEQIIAQAKNQYTPPQFVLASRYPGLLQQS